MKRRNFLKGILAAPMIAAVPVLAKTNERNETALWWNNEKQKVEIRSLTTDWKPIPESLIDPESPITKTLKIKLSDNRVYSKEQVRDLINKISEESPNVMIE